MKKNPLKGFEFIGKNGDFKLKNPENSSYLYFPLANEAGLMSSITPALNGDVKTGQNSFLTEPVSSENLHNNRSSRNFWFFVHGRKTAWSAAGESAAQKAARVPGDGQSGEQAVVEAGMLWHEVTRENRKLGLKAQIENFVPVSQDTVELMRVTVTNTGRKSVKLTPTAAVPLYGRSADNIRDHRHVTSLLHRVRTVKNGVAVTPTMCFDERGHTVNGITYGVYGAEGDGTLPAGFFPVTEDFIGEGGSFDWPEKIVVNALGAMPSGKRFDGFEAMGAIRFRDVVLRPGQSRSYVLALSVEQPGRKAPLKYLDDRAFEKALSDNKKFWSAKTDSLTFSGADPDFDSWLKWVTVQPVLRRIYGCSFLPHHDYGRGGRGWRDLWQDCLALIVMEPEGVRQMLLNNYGGVRLDGSNATIIGSAPGEFIADRNNISRVWMDHGAWPFLTTRLYLDWSGDLKFLLEQQSYFKDRQFGRSRTPDENWTPEYGNRQKTAFGGIYTGTVLEHILIQNLAPFYHAGEHGNILLEGADWNDALDMARDRGESVAFTCFYAWNLAEIAKLLREAHSRLGLSGIEVAREMVPLFDTLDRKIDYASVKEKRGLLSRYFESCLHRVSGEKAELNILSVAKDLEGKAESLMEQVRKNEWVTDARGNGWFNGYYDNSGARVEGVRDSGKVRMTLTGQVFAVMGGVATGDQAERIVRSVKKYLKDPAIGGYRLNTDFGEIKPDFGRAFAFAFGHKENGAVFSHMAVMYANALYRRGLVRDGWDVLKSLYDLSSDFPRARIYPGLPEYFNEKRRGMYHYLTGSASWLALTVLSETYGVRGKLGDLELEPKLLPDQFDAQGRAGVRALFAGRRLEIVYHASRKAGSRRNRIGAVRLDGKPAGARIAGHSALVRRSVLERLEPGRLHRLDIELE